jgi:hypothetical protein
MKKGYNLSLETEIMETFKKSIPETPEGQKANSMSSELERILTAYNQGKLIFVNEINGKAGALVTGMKSLHESVDSALKLMEILAEDREIMREGDDGGGFLDE